MYTSNMHVIGIDIGNGTVKTTHSENYSSVRKLSGNSSLYDKILKWNGEYYAIGESVPQEYKPIKYSDEDMLVQTMSAIAEEIVARNINDEVIEIWLGCGTPFSHWMKQKDNISHYFMRNSVLEYWYNTRKFEIRIKGVNVMPQGLASTRSYRTDTHGNFLSVDGGFGTIELLVFKNGKVDEVNSGSEEYGTFSCFREVNNSIMSTFSYQIDYGLFDNYLHGYKDTVTSKLHPVLDEAIRHYCEKVMAIVRNYGYHPDICGLHVMGGIANFIEDYYDFSGMNVTFDKAVNSNAAGYEYFVKQNLKRQGVDYRD